jgi:hypothetical protein
MMGETSEVSGEEVNNKTPSGYEGARCNKRQPLIFQIKLPELAP